MEEDDSTIPLVTSKTKQPRSGRWRRWLSASAVAMFLLALVGVISYHVRSENTVLQKAEIRRCVLLYAANLLFCQDLTKKRLPPAVYVDATGKTLGSWRFQTIIHSEWSDWPQFRRDLPWDAAINRQVAAQSPFCVGQDNMTKERLDTTIFAVTGPGTAFDPKRTYRFSDLPGNLILLVDIAHSHTHWMAPGDLDVEHVPESLTEGLDGLGVCVAFVDGAVVFLRHDVPLADLKKLFTIESAKAHDRERLLGPYVLRGRLR